jgi:hypothetical protein
VFVAVMQRTGWSENAWVLLNMTFNPMNSCHSAGFDIQVILGVCCLFY